MNFTWNEDKARKVKNEHKVEFDKLFDIFEDDFSLEEIHFITARKAEKFYVKQYEEHI